MSVERIIGIDFGTSTSVIRVKRYNNGEPVEDRLSKQDVIFDGSRPTVPTLIQRTDKGTYYGYDAERPKKGEILYQNFKVDLESPDPAKKQEARELTEEFFAYLAKTYKSQSEGGHFGDSGDTQRTVVSYPVKWSEDTKEFMLQTAEKVGFKNVEGMDEAQAAIHAVTVQSEDFLTKHGLFTAGVPCNILLVDMGAGTTDLVLCRHTPGEKPKNEILCTWPKEGDALFGGREVDELLRSYFRSLLPGDKADSVLKKIKVKEFKSWKETVLSPALERNETVEEFNSIDNAVEWMEIEIEPYELDRARFEELAEEYLGEFPKLIADCIDQSGLQKEEIDLVILTGGHSQWYFVKEMFTDNSKVDLPKINQNPERIIPITRPQETVALGMIYRPLSAEFEKASEPKTSEPKPFEPEVKEVNSVYEGDETIYKEELFRRLIGVLRKVSNEKEAKAELSCINNQKMGVGGDITGEAEEEHSFDVELTKVDSTAIVRTMSVVYEVTNLSLDESLDLLRNAPQIVKWGVTKEEAEKIKNKLEACNAKVKLIKNMTTEMSDHMEKTQQAAAPKTSGLARLLEAAFYKINGLPYD